VTLYSRALVRDLRQAALRRIRQSKALRREHRLRRRRRRETSSVRVAFFYCFLVAVALRVMANFSFEKPAFPFVVVALYATGTVVFRSSALFERLHGPGELAIFFGLPITDQDFFRLQWKKFLLRSSWFFLFTLLAYVVLVFEQAAERPSFFLICIFAALAQWLVMVSLSVLALDLRHPWLPRIASALYVLMVVCMYAPAGFSAAVAALTVVLPAGWVNRGYLGLIGGDWSAILWFVPAVALGLAGLGRARHLRENYVPRLFEDLESHVPAEFADPDNIESPPPQPDVRGPVPSPELLTQASGRVASGELGWALNWNAFGWIERIAGRWLTDEDKPVANFMVGEVLGQWSSRWLKAFYLTAAAVVIAYFVTGFPLWLSVGAAAIAAMYAAPLIGGGWVGFAPVLVSLQQSSLAAFYPVTYWQVSRVVLKVNLVRLLAYSLLLFPVALAISRQVGLDLETGAGIGVRILFWLALLQFLGVLLLHSQGTDDTRTLSFRKLPLLFLALLSVLLLLAGGFLSFIPDVPNRALVGALIGAPVLPLTWWLYGLFYSRGRVDLMHPPDNR
jgi:hypothetical protein